MKLYAILRRNGWKTPEDVHAAADRSKKVGEEMPNQVRWIRTYVMAEADGTLGSVCIYEAASPEAVRDHAKRAELGVSEIRPITGSLIVRADPTA